MKRVLVIACLAVSLASHIAANEAGPPSITKKTLVGSWEAVSPYNPCIYRLEIAERGPSYLVYILSRHPIMFRLVSSEVHDGHVTLRFRRMRKSELNFEEFIITAKGQGDATEGYLTGTLRIRKWHDDDYTEAIAFARPPWIGALPWLSKQTEELMRRARHEAK
jgi:hypothetical protein